MKLQSATFGTALLMGALVATAPSAGAGTPPTPAMGTNYWDCVISGGAQKGIAFLTFYPNGTFSGYQLLSATPSSSNPDVSVRTPYGDVGRGTNGSAPPKTNLFGFTSIEGPWGYDYRWRIIGNYSVEIPGSSGTNTELIPISFIGKTTQGRSLTLVAYTPNGKLTYTGRPYRPDAKFDPNAIGDWSATKTVNGQSFIEFFPLAKYDNPLGYAGIYYTGVTTNTITEDTNTFSVITGAGIGPSYTTFGYTIVSSQKKIGFAFKTVPNNFDYKATNVVFTLSSSYGNLSRLRHGYQAPTKGIQEPTDKVIFNAFKPTNSAPVSF